MAADTNSEVPRVELNHDGTINLEIDTYGFDPGTPIEISGHVTQDNGAVATFYHVQEMPKSGPLLVTKLSVVPAAKPAANNFVPGLPITVVVRASQVWITVLREDKDPGARVSHVDGEELRSAWTADDDDAHWAVSWPRQKTPAVWRSRSSKQSSTLLRHGTWWDGVKADPLPGVMEGRFTRLFPDLPGARFDRADLKKLARRMTAPPEEPGQEPRQGADPEENPGIPAAYTYLGQFVDHDLTFDPISQLRKGRTPVQLRALVDFRTPRFDLDNLYGRGPDDQPYMYDDDGICLLPGEAMPGNPFDPGAVQLPRGPNGRALIGDPRDDENRIVAQLHAIFLRFHNEVVRELGGKKHVSFEEVRQQVRWHYQWILVDEFLRIILQEETYKNVFPDPYSPVTSIPRLRENDLELMPVEFSVAAYRFGHSMVRSQYRLNPALEHPIPIFSDHPDDFTADLGGFRPIPANWAIDWHFFINLDHSARPPDELQLSYKIDTSLVNPLGHLPARVASHPSSLALRNLERGWIFQLPSGQNLATALGLPVIADEDLVIRKAIVGTPKYPITKIAPGFVGNAPLWAYILSEAQVTSWKNRHGQAKDCVPIKLGPLGGQLVAEVFASLLRGDRMSYLYTKPAFEPIANFAHNGTFGLAELINVALGRTH